MENLQEKHKKEDSQGRIVESEKSVNCHRNKLKDGCIMEDQNKKENRIVRFIAFIVGIFALHVLLGLLFESHFPGINILLIVKLFPIIIGLLLLYIITKKYFLKLSIFFSRKVLLLAFISYLCMVLFTWVMTHQSLSNIQADKTVQQYFPTSSIHARLFDVLTLNQVTIIDSPEDYVLDKSLEQKVDYLKKYNENFELYFTKTVNRDFESYITEIINHDISVMVAYYPHYGYKEIPTIFFYCVLYMYVWVLFNLLKYYLQEDAHLGHIGALFVPIAPFWFVILMASGVLREAHTTSYQIASKKTFLEYLQSSYAHIEENPYSRTTGGLSGSLYTHIKIQKITGELK